MSPLDATLTTWKTRLLDTSRRNRLLYFSPRRGNVQIVAPEADEIFAALVPRGEKLTFRGNSLPQAQAPSAQMRDPSPPSPPSPPTPLPQGEGRRGEGLPGEERRGEGLPGEERRGEGVPGEGGESKLLRTELYAALSEQQLAAALYNLRSHARSALEEQGVNILFLAFGMLHWREPSGHAPVMSPLLLVPVQLERTSVTQPFTLQARDEDILLNPTLAHKLSLDYRIALPRLPDDGETLTPRGIVEAVAATVRDLPDWTVSPDVYLELFSFEKLVMLKDLEAHKQELEAHPLIRALAGDPAQLPPPPTDLPRVHELDAQTTPLETFQVLDADSSQQVAIEWSKRGASFVIEGPPGTGKSQTIANLIAEALAHNRRVLFVSAKMAALEVVYKRLAECGLGHLVLEAHSPRARRSALVTELGKALYEDYPAQAPPLERLARLGELRAELNEYARVLHTPLEPLHQSPFEAYCVLAALTETPELHFEFPEVEQVDTRRFWAIQTHLENIAALADVWESWAQHPWHGVTLTAYSYQTCAEIEQQFGGLIQDLALLASASDRLATALTLPPRETPLSLDALVRLDEIARHARQSPAPPVEWFQSGQVAALRQLAAAAQAQYGQRQRAYAELAREYDDSLLARPDLAPIRARLENAQANALRFLDATYRDDLRVVRHARKTGGAVSLDEALRVLDAAQALQALDAQLAVLQAEYQTRFGALFQGQATDWAQLGDALTWVDEVLALFAPEAPPASFVDLVCHQLTPLASLARLHDEWQALFARFQNRWRFLEQLFPFEAQNLQAASLGQVREWLGVRLDHLDALEAWLTLQGECAALEALGLSAFLDSARAAKLEGGEVKSAFLKRFYLLWLDGVYRRYPVLRRSSELYRKAVAQFCREDVEQLRIARERLVQQWAAARPSVAWSAAPSSEVTLLKRELAKRKHHKSIRRLLAEIPNLLLALKPCLMMSPLSVSQYLAAAPLTFDLVIFDEASQIPPEEALAAVMRARQIVVAGDHQQLPPTPFFESLDAEIDLDAEAGGVMESLLQQAAVVLPSVQLMWHYRSRHESLLAFSNHHLYQDRLITFPNAAVQDAQLGVEFVHVEGGVYDRARTRTNPVEAQRVAQLVLEHIRASPLRSLGVVTFSQAQRAAIDLELQNLLRLHPELEPELNRVEGEPFFVKSLENVQGDERDVIFFSVGYGRDTEGVLTLNFGPLNGQDGARRLNVAITRAREHVKLVSSLLPADLDPARLNSQGVQLLRAYMEYCLARGHLTRHTAMETPRPAPLLSESEMSFSQRVREALETAGLTVHANVGAGSQRIDLAVVDPANPERYKLGIELEGTTFCRANTARERERLRSQVLAQLGWRTYRLRMRDWLADPAAQIEEIVQLASSLDAPNYAWSWRATRVKGARRGAGAAADETERALVPTGMAVYVPAVLSRMGTPEQFFDASELLLEQVFVQLTEQEGPIHWHAAVRRIAACWGIPRVTPAVEEHLDRVLSQLVERQQIVLRDDFLWSSVTVQVLARQPAPGQPPRPIEEIALEEIAKAAYLYLQNALSLTPEDWIQQTACILGYPRPGERVKRRIETALARLEESGLARRENGRCEWVRPPMEPAMQIRV